MSLVLSTTRLLSLLVALTGCSTTQVVEVESKQQRIVLGVVDRCGYRELGNAPGRFVIRRSGVAFLRAEFSKGIVRYFALSQEPTLRLRLESGLPKKPDQSPQLSTKLRREVTRLVAICFDVLWTGDPKGDRLKKIRVATRRIVADPEIAGLGWLVTNLESMCVVRVQIQPEGSLPLNLVKTLFLDIRVTMSVLSHFVTSTGPLRPEP